MSKQKLNQGAKGDTSLMNSETNPIKEYLFEYINNSEHLLELASEKKFDIFIENVVKNCYDKIILMEQKEKAVAILATGLLHYLLTCSLINTQRKIEYQGMDVDIVIPDTQTLEKDAKKTLLICIPESSDPKIINDTISRLEKIQPETKNIWVILSKDIPINARSFVLDKENNSFSKIIFKIAQFRNIAGDEKFKILRI